MEIKKVKYEVVGLIKKVCVCEKCHQVMQKYDNTILPTNPYQYDMYCPNCDTHEYVSCDRLQDELEIVKKVED